MRTLFAVFIAAGIMINGAVGQQIPQININMSAANDGVTGTTLYKLTKIDPTNGRAKTIAIGENASTVGIAVGGAGKSGNVTICTYGNCPCIFDNTPNARDYVTSSNSAAGQCHASAGLVIGTQLIGNVSTATSTIAGTRMVDMTLKQTIITNGGTGGGTGTVTSVVGISPISGNITTSGNISCPTCATAPSPLTFGRILVGGGGQALSLGDLTGDVTTNGTTATTLGSTGVTAGNCGDATHTCGLTIDSQGRIRAQTNTVISGSGAGGGGTVTVVNANSPLSGGPINTNGTLTCPTCTVNVSPLNLGQLVFGNGGQNLTVGNLSGDITTSGTGVTVLNTSVNSSPGLCGDGTHFPNITTNNKGLVTNCIPQLLTSGGSGTVISVTGTTPLVGTITTSGNISCPTCAVSASSLTSGQLIFGAGLQGIAVGNLTGDATTSGSTITLSGSGVTAGACGDATHSCGLTIDAKGRITAQTNTVITSSSGSGTLTSVNTALPLTGGPITTAGIIACATCTTSAAPLSAGQLLFGVGGQGIIVNDLTGDVTTAGSGFTTLSSTGVIAGPCGDATHSCALNIDAKGRVTARNNALITGVGGGITNITTVSPISGGPISTTGAISCPTCLTSSTIFGGSIVGNSFNTLYTYNDIRNYGAVCDGSNSNSSVLSALTAGLHEIFIPSGCSWSIPNSTWSFTPAGGLLQIVPADSLPAGIRFIGQHWERSTIRMANPASGTQYIGPSTSVENINLVNGSCGQQNPSSGAYVGAPTCPTAYLNNQNYTYAGKVNVSGTTVNWVSGDQFVTNATGANWMYWGPVYPYQKLVSVINGVQVTIASVTSATSMTLTANAGTLSNVDYYVQNYIQNPELVRTTIYINTLGPQDGNGIHVEGNGGDAIYAAVHAQAGIAFRGANYDTPATVFLADRHSNGTGFAVIDGDSSITSAAGYTYNSSTRTSGAMAAYSNDTANFSSGDVVWANMANGSGGFSGNFLRYTRNGLDRYKVDRHGKTECKVGGPDAVCGTDPLVGGVLTHSTLALEANDSIEIFLESCINCGTIYVDSMSSTTGIFTIRSTNASDASVVFWRLTGRF